MNRHKATDYVAPNGEERHVPENFRNAFDYLIYDVERPKSSFNHAVKVLANREADLLYLSGDLFYCTDHMTPNVVDLLGRLDINIEEECGFMVLRMLPQRTRSLRS